VAISGGTFVIAGELAMMAPSDQEHMAVIIAVLNLFCAVGSAMGSTVSAAIWTGTFYKNLAKHVPADINIREIYQSLPKQLSHEWGSPARMGIAQAYGDSQRLMLITSICLLFFALVAASFWRDINVKNIKQSKGRVI